MKTKITLLFIFVWASLGAQTFEKTIDYPGYLSNVFSVNTDSISNIYLTGLNTKLVGGLVFSKSNTTLYKIDPIGNLLENKIYSTNDFIPSIDTSFNQIVTNISFIENNELVHIGYVKIKAPQDYAKIVYKTDLSFNLKSLQISDTLRDSVDYFYNFNKYNNKVYAVGAALSFSNPSQSGTISTYNSLRNHETSKSILSYTDSIYSVNVIDLLFDKDKNQYIFTWGFYGPPMFFTSPIQILKFDTTSRLIKRQYLENPSIRPLVDAPIYTTFGDAKWISDSTFIFATAGDTDLDLKGDIHLFVYDTALTQLQYKRIEALDTLLEAEPRSLAYDSLCNCFYFGVTQKFEDVNNPVLNSRDSSHFRLIKFDKNLNVLFDRQYRRDKSMKLERVTTDTKGNVIMAGYTQDLSQPFNETSIYILKVDSNGNFTRTSLVDNNQIDPLDYAIFPNPVKEQVTFRQYNQQVSYQLSLFDIKGRLAKQIEVMNSETIINLTDLKSGTYIYQLIDENGKRGSGKLMKE